MKPARSPCAAVLVAGLLCSTALLSAAETGAPAPLPGKGRLTDRIDALLRPHLKPAALPVVLPNPFVVVRGSADFTETATAAVAAQVVASPVVETGPVTDAELLARYAARLRIGGTVEVGGVTSLIINQMPYREGDVLVVEATGRVITLQIVRLTSTELTLGFNEAAQIIRLKGPARPRESEK